MTFADALRMHRDRAGLSRPALAALSGIPASSIEKYETDTEPTIERARRLAIALEVTLDELLNGEAVS